MKSSILLAFAAFGAASVVGTASASGAAAASGATTPTGAITPIVESAAVESAIPTAFEKERYEETASQSPFVLATPVDDKPDEKTGPLKDLVVTGLGKLDDGQPLVFVQRIGDDRSMKFTGNLPNDDGLSVKLVKWGERWDKTSIVMRHGSDEAEIHFKDKTQMSAGGVAAGGPNVVRQPGHWGCTWRQCATAADCPERESTGWRWKRGWRAESRNPLRRIFRARTEHSRTAAEGRFPDRILHFAERRI
jgi:hypothetical protein